MKVHPHWFLKTIVIALLLMVCTHAKPKTPKDKAPRTEADIIHVTFEYGAFSSGGLSGVLDGLVPRQLVNFGVKVVMPFVMTLKEQDTKAKTLLRSLSSVPFAGTNEQNYTVNTKQENFTFSVGKYHLEVNNKTVEFYMVRLSNVEFPDSKSLSAPALEAKMKMYQDIWKLTIYPFGIQANSLPYPMSRTFPLMSIFNLCFNSVAVRLLDDITQRKETVVNLHGGVTSNVLLFMNTLYQKATRKWKNVLVFHDNVNFCDAIAEATLRNFYIDVNLDHYSTNHYFIPEAYGIRHSQQIVAVSDAMMHNLHHYSSQLVPFPFLGKLRREFFLAIEGGKMKAINGDANVEHVSPLLNRDIFPEPLTAQVPMKKRVVKEKVTEELESVGKYCKNNATIWALFSGSVTCFRTEESLQGHVRTLVDNHVCPIFLSPRPDELEMADLLVELDDKHDIIWLPQGKLQTMYASHVRLASDFTVIPSECGNVAMSILEATIHGMPVVASGDVAVGELLKPRKNLPDLKPWEKLSDLHPATKNVQEYLTNLSLCHVLKPAFVENGYSYKLGKGFARYDVPDFSEFSAAIGTLLSDLKEITMRRKLNSYISALTLEAHCRSWDNPRGSAHQYSELFRDLIKNVGNRPESSAKLTLPQMSLFLDGSHNIPACPELSVGKDMIPTDWTRHSDLPIEFREIYSEFFPAGKKTMMLIECNHTTHAGRQISANAIDSDHFPFILCAIDDTKQLVVDMDNSYQPLSLIGSELPLEHVTVLMIEITNALHNIHRNNLCHGNLTEDAIFVSQDVYAPHYHGGEHVNFNVYINIFTQHHVDDIHDCIESDKEGFVGIVNRFYVARSLNKGDEDEEE